VTDGAGGAFVAWRDAHNSDDVFLQRITALGLIAPGWPVNGLPIVVLPSIQELSGLAADGLGGAFVAWEDLRYFPGTASDAFAQRVLADGSNAPGWAPMGNPANLAPGDQSNPQVAQDGLGGVYLFWRDSRDYSTTGYDVYAQHLSSSGTVASGWPADGLALCTLPGNQGGIYFVMPDDSGGAVFEWGDGRPGAPGGYALRVHADGTIAPGWPANGIRLATNGVRAAARDEAGGFYVVSPTPGPSLGFDGAYYLLRFTFAGALAPGWPPGGALVCNAPGDRAGVSIDADGTGGALLSWYDYRSPVAGQIFAARVQSDASLAPGWTVNGTLVSDPAAALQNYDPFVLHDGLGGGYVVWQSQGGNQSPSTIQHLSANGQVFSGWPQAGLRVAPSGGQVDTRIATDGVGGAIVAWDEGSGIWAQRFASNGPTPVLLSLVNADGTPERVALTWQGSGAGSLRASIFRRTSPSAWQQLGLAIADGADRLRYEDRSVTPGERYAYRVGWSEDGAERFSAEAWVDVPRAVFALRGAVPNPASGADLHVAFSLAKAGSARIELLDASGRLIERHEEPALEAGEYRLRPFSRRVSPGIYWLRLSQNAQTATARAVVIQ
jgi:hypothetical protein